MKGLSTANSSEVRYFKLPCGRSVSWSIRHSSMISRASSMPVNKCRFRHPSRKRPLKLSIYAFRVGLPGSMKRRCTPWSSAHRPSARPRSSGPLSTTRMSGYPRSRATRSSMPTTRSPGSEKSTSMAGHSRVRSSLRLAVRNLRPSARASCVKSSDQRRSAAIGHQAPSRPSRGSLLRFARRSNGRSSR